MKTIFALASALLLSSPALADDPEPHLEAAKTAAGFEFTGTLARICIAPGLAVSTGPRGVIPDRALWHAEPVRMFDNLYFIGTRVHSAWALKGSGGIIIIDTLFNYAVEDEMVNGLKKVGLEQPAVMKAWIDDIPMKRLLQPSEIAATIGFLVSDAASGITGQLIMTDAGYSAA